MFVRPSHLGVYSILCKWHKHQNQTSHLSQDDVDSHLDYRPMPSRYWQLRCFRGTSLELRVIFLHTKGTITTLFCWKLKAGHAGLRYCLTFRSGELMQTQTQSYSVTNTRQGWAIVHCSQAFNYTYFNLRKLCPVKAAKAATTVASRTFLMAAM